MTAKKLLMPLLLIAVIVTSMAGCMPKTEYDDKGAVKTETTEYDDKEVLKIETSIYGGYTLYPSVSFNRTFDFNADTVTDERYIDYKESTIELLLKWYNEDPVSGYESAEDYEAYLQSYYNTPELFYTFSQEQAESLLKKIKSYGIYTWKENYIREAVADAAWHSVSITFKDGTVKTSRFYCEYPDNFNRIAEAFNENLSVGLWNDNKNN